jgi:hypothetical protein
LGKKISRCCPLKDRLKTSSDKKVQATVGNGISFRKKFRGIDSEWLPLFRGRKCSFQGIPRFTVLSETCFRVEFRELAPIFFLHGTEFRAFFSSAGRSGTVRRVFYSPEWFRMEFREFASIFVPWYRILSIFFLCGTVRNGLPRVFCSAKQSEFRQNKPIVPSFLLPRNNFLSEIATLVQAHRKLA